MLGGAGLLRLDQKGCWGRKRLRDTGIRHLISSASISSVSVSKRHFFDNVKFCSAGIVSLQALHWSRWHLMAELDELKLLERWFSILANTCLVVISIYDVLLLQEQVYLLTAFEQKRVGRGNQIIKRLKPSLSIKLGHSQGVKSLLHVFPWEVLC